MSTTWNLLENSQGELKVTVDGEKWAAAQKKAFGRIAKDLQVPGFRKGKVPTSMAKKYISEGSILQEALNDALLNEALQDGIKEFDLKVIDQPQLKSVDEMDPEKVSFTIALTVEPEVTLGEYKGLEIEKEAVIVEDAEIDAQLEQLQKRFTELTLKDEDATVENGDTAVIDFEGFKDGVAFDGGKGENYPLEIGSGSFIPGFEEQLIGMKAEESKDIDVTFPEDYNAEDLAGAAVVFKVTVHEIKAKTLPEIDDDLIAEAEVEGVETVAQYKEYMLKELTAQKEQDADDKFEKAVIDAVIENATFDIPEVMINNEADDMVKEYANQFASQGLSMEQYYQMFGMNEDQFKEQLKEPAKERVSQRLVLAAVAKAEGIEATEEDINKEYEEVAAQWNMKAEDIKPIISADLLTDNIVLRKAADFLKNSVK